MAFIHEKECYECARITPHTNQKCDFCHVKEEIARIARWNTKSLEEQIKNLRERIEKLEDRPNLLN